MVSKRKIKLDKLRVSLFICLNCGHAIPPAGSKRVDSQHLECPKCVKKFAPQKKNPSAYLTTQAGG